MKICTGCDTEKSLDEFYRTKRSKDGRQPRCKICMRDCYNASRDKKKKHYRDVQRLREHANQKRYYKWKAELGCSICPESEPCALEPHHLDPNEKDFNVSNRSRGMAWETLLIELNKCILVCRNCHSTIHAGIIEV